MRVRVFDPEMCCSSGVCGPAPDPALITFQTTLERLKAEGADVVRYQLSRQSQAFLSEPEVYQLLLHRGVDALPVVTVDGHVISVGTYPTYEQLKENGPAAAAVVPARRPGCG